MPNFKGEPIQRGRKIHWVGDICNFRLKSPFISETVRVCPTVDMERCVGSDDLERRDTMVKFFRRISLITLVPFDLERSNSAG